MDIFWRIASRLYKTHGGICLLARAFEIMPIVSHIIHA